MTGCKTINSEVEQQHQQEVTESIQEQEDYNQSDFLTWTSRVLKQNALKLELLKYDTSKPPDEQGNYPVKEKLTITDDSQEDHSTEGQNEINTDIKKESIKEITDKIQDNTTDKLEQNTQSKPQQWTKLIWAVVAILVVGFVIYKKIKK